MTIHLNEGDLKAAAKLYVQQVLGVKAAMDKVTLQVQDFSTATTLTGRDTEVSAIVNVLTSNETQNE